MTSATILPCAPSPLAGKGHKRQVKGVQLVQMEPTGPLSLGSQGEVFHPLSLWERGPYPDVYAGGGGEESCG
jgi:hypothetical protein